MQLQRGLLYKVSNFRFNKINVVKGICMKNDMSADGKTAGVRFFEDPALRQSERDRMDREALEIYYQNQIWNSRKGKCTEQESDILRALKVLPASVVAEAFKQPLWYVRALGRFHGVPLKMTEEEQREQIEMQIALQEELNRMDRLSAERYRKRQIQEYEKAYKEAYEEGRLEAREEAVLMCLKLFSVSKTAEALELEPAYVSSVARKYNINVA